MSGRFTLTTSNRLYATDKPVSRQQEAEYHRYYGYPQLPGKHVLVSPLWIREVSWSDRTLRLALTWQQVEQSPEYDPRRSPSPACEKSLHRYYARSHDRR
jgi:hypothetical protein